METAKILIYDGSFNGFLTAVFKAFEEKVPIADIQANSVCQSGLFSETETIFTQMELAKRVWNGIQSKSNVAIKNIYFAFLSGSKGIELLLYRYIRGMFPDNQPNGSGLTDDMIIKIGHLAKNVGREKYRMEATVRFQLTQDGIYFAPISPDFDVLPLISKHFRARFNDHPWIIYDTKRKYGLYFNLASVEIISLDLQQVFTNGVHMLESLGGEQICYGHLPKDDFKHLNIKSHINQKLHTSYMSKSQEHYIGNRNAV
tara:strand:- start:1169 stop:1942 length:774 start_codon:yes stop_codon:yes gene_type:complete